VNYLLIYLILLLVTLWLAELVAVLFDEPSVKIAQWAYKRTLEPVERFDSKPRSDLWAKA
jgi:hypothetical protein